MAGNEGMFIFFSVLCILYLFRKNAFAGKVLTPLFYVLLFLDLAYLWIFTDESIGIGLRGGRMKPEAYGPEWKTYVLFLSVIIGLFCLAGAFYYLSELLKNIRGGALRQENAGNSLAKRKRAKKKKTLRR